MTVVTYAAPAQPPNTQIHQGVTPLVVLMPPASTKTMKIRSMSPTKKLIMAAPNFPT